jgi:sulfonate transport system ATP-binding protein
MTPPQANQLSSPAVRGPASTAGLMFQEPRLLPWLDVAASVALGLRDDERKGPDSRRRVGELLAAVGLDGPGGQLPPELSGGKPSGWGWPGPSRLALLGALGQGERPGLAG